MAKSSPNVVIVGWSEELLILTETEILKVDFCGKLGLSIDWYRWVFFMQKESRGFQAYFFSFSVVLCSEIILLFYFILL